MTPHTDAHAALIIAELLALVPLDDAPIIEEALDYLAAARREHPATLADMSGEAREQAFKQGDIERLWKEGGRCSNGGVIRFKRGTDDNHHGINQSSIYLER